MLRIYQACNSVPIRNLLGSPGSGGYSGIAKKGSQVAFLDSNCGQSSFLLSIICAVLSSCN